MNKEKISILQKCLEKYNSNTLPSEIKFLGKNKDGEEEYEAIQEYPYLLKFFNPFTYEEVWQLIEKNENEKIIKTAIRFLKK